MPPTNRRALSGDRNQCPTCDEFFNSTSAFDFHRVAKEKGNPFPRRCLSPEEMTAKGMSVNAGGFWIERARQIAPETADGGARSDSLGEDGPNLIQPVAGAVTLPEAA